eukprot:TRINITY_DN9746_c0_g1_i1.p1 TRINITY_DN9746_c0_g1~~TRINITY_DN9746_c0_g1_i1.p1  ORF type:complete len:232 (-),score=14.06 TRINITY_DN9746_c0_g1_i1:202-855(-)
MFSHLLLLLLIVELSIATELSLGIAILSAPTHTAQRRALRNTWLRADDAPCVKGAFFVVGESGDNTIDERVRKESARNQDMLLIEHQESFSTLTRKVAMSFDAVLKQLPQSTHIMKIDDDVALIPKSLCDELFIAVSQSDNKPLYFGFFHEKAFVIRHPSAKYAEPTMTDCSHHLPYASGAGYVVDAGFARHIANPPMPLRSFHNEDVATGFFSRSI